MIFQERVWKLLEKIPEGRVTTYKIIAKKLGTKAYRAVGNACNSNPNAPYVPCHRVVSSDGSLGGYAYGSARKSALLRGGGVSTKKGKIEDFKSVLFKF